MKRKENGQKRIWLRIGLSLVLVFAILLTGVYFSQAKAAEKGRRIHVVLDDSESMINEYRFCRAMYALDVFATMLDENDSLKVFSLNNKQTVEVSGKEKAEDRTGRIDQWGKNLIKGGLTPSQNCEKAASELLKDQDNYTDNWLVILSDGDFNSGNIQKPERLEAKLEEWNQNGIKTVYLGIGEKASAMKDRPSDNGFAAPG